MSKTILKIDGMMCEMCVSKIADALNSVDGVDSVLVDLKKSTASIEHQNVSEEDLVMAVLDVGFKAKVKHGFF